MVINWGKEEKNWGGETATEFWDRKGTVGRLQVGISVGIPS
jgi:hypothetical protein